MILSNGENTQKKKNKKEIERKWLILALANVSRWPYRLHSLSRNKRWTMLCCDPMPIISMYFKWILIITRNRLTLLVYPTDSTEHQTHNWNHIERMRSRFFFGQCKRKKKDFQDYDVFPLSFFFCCSWTIG